MIKPEIPKNEKERLNALYSYDILGTLPERKYDSLTLIAAKICDTPISLVSLIDPDRQWFKSHHGLDAEETPREYAFCAHAINDQKKVLVVNDSTKDERFHDNPLVTDAPNVIFYAGAPLVTPEGYAIGTLCVIDNKPRNLSEGQIEALQALADQVISQLELRKRNKSLELQTNRLMAMNEKLEAFGARLTHDLKAPLRGIRSLFDFISEDYADAIDDDGKELFEKIKNKLDYMNNVINGMLKFSKESEVPIDIEKFNLSELVNEVLGSIDVKNKCKLIENNLNVNIEQYKFGISCIIQNLISNSIKFIKDSQPTISVELKDLPQHHLIIYEDNGPGIPIDKRDKVFDLFETLGENVDSTGIGLATSKSIMDRINGTIHIKDKPDHSNGVRFEILIPKENPA